MGDMIKVKVNEVTKEYPKGTSFKVISEEFQGNYDYDIILVTVNGKLQELFKKANEDCELSFVTIEDSSGRRTYIRGMILLMLKAVYSELGRENIEKVLVEYSIANGLYCDVVGEIKLTEEIIKKIKDKMIEYISEDIPFIKRSIGTDEAIELFKEYKMYDKEKLFKYRRVSKANIYSLGEFEDYYYGYMPYSTGILKCFNLELFDGGLVLVLPRKSSPQKVETFVPHQKLYYTLKESNNWAKMMDIDTVGALNDIVSKGELNDIILIQEALQEKKIGEIAEAIKREDDKKFVMIAGPSSSGKTTFSHRLSIQLKTQGLKPHPIGVDNYFLNRDETPMDEYGELDFESLRAIDLTQFNKDMVALLNGETVNIPHYNFVTGRREYKDHYLTLGEDDILVIEGIHGLNDELSYSLPKESKYKIYISALTQLNVDEHNRIPTTDGRLIRRMVRDARTRGMSASDTIKMWPSVRRGEEENIFPFQEEADVMFNSALIYELSVLKQYAEPLLFGVDRDSEEYLEAKRLLKFFDYFIGTPADVVPMNSILKEFIGGSLF